MTIHRNQILGALLGTLVLLVLNATAVFARTWTLSELDTLSDRKWLWIDEKYKEPIPENSNTNEPLTELPRKSRGPKPDYPRAALAAGKEGIVWMKIFIDERGLVRAVHVLEDSDSRVGFEEAALEAARKTQWRPAYRDRERIAVWVKYEVAFFEKANKWEEPIQMIEPWDWRVIPSRSVTRLEGDSNSELEDPPPISDKLTSVEKMPKLKKAMTPAYPTAAWNKVVEGSVWIDVLVDVDGRVVRAKVMTESGCRCGFEEAALWAAIDSEWKPAVKDGKPVPIWVYYEVQFKLGR